MKSLAAFDLGLSIFMRNEIAPSAAETGESLMRPLALIIH